MVPALISSAQCVGFSGSRNPGGTIPPEVLLGAIAAVSPSASVFVGCAKGVDAVVRRTFGSRCQVFSVASGKWGSGRGAFAARSTACVKAVAAAGGMWVSFPSSACPAGLLPSASSCKCFSGSGSGSWASLAYALGSGVPCLVFLPKSVVAPAGWGLTPVVGCDHWFSSVPIAAQLPLF